MSGGFGKSVVDTAAAYNLPIVAYEGGPSIYTDKLDTGAANDDGVTLFMSAVNRHPRFAEIYRIHLNQAWSKGLWSHMMFVDSSNWGKYGQWGHLEYLTQPPAESSKYSFLLNWFHEAGNLRHPTQPLGSVPYFLSESELPRCEVGLPYSQMINFAGGDGALQLQVIGKILDSGLTFDPVTRTVSGVATQIGTSYLYLRLTDADGDPAWRTFSIRIVERLPGPPVVVDFESVTPSPTGPEPEPIDILGYRFTSTDGGGLRLEDTRDGWASRVLMCHKWGRQQVITRIDGGIFDLTALDVAVKQGASVRISGEGLDGYSTNHVVNLADVRQPMTRVVLDWLNMTRVTFTWFEKANASGGTRWGGIDNILFHGDGVPTLSVTTTDLPGGTVGVPYNATLTASGGTPSYRWSLASGALPNGLSLASSTGVVSGTPTATGTFAFTVRVQDQAGASATRLLTNTIEPALSTAPNPPTNLLANAVSSSRIDLSWSDNSSNESSFRLERSNNGSSDWVAIAILEANVTSFSDSSLPASSTRFYRVRSSNA